MIVIICGGRDISREDAINLLERDAKDDIAFATGLHSFSIAKIIHGGCRGADEGAAAWAAREGINTVSCPANWKKHGKAAGPIRNRKMIVDHKPDLVLALPGGKGTADMIRAAEEYGIRVVRVGCQP